MTNTQTSPQTQNGMLVSNLHVDKLITHYKKERWVKNSEKIGKADSLSTWYGLEELQSFLDLARENQADGIKMYFGVYPADFEKVPEFQGRQTVVLVATRKNHTENGITNKDVYLLKDGKAEILAFNAGQLCPPWCGGNIGTAFDFLQGIEMEKIGITLVDGGNEIIVI